MIHSRKSISVLNARLPLISSKVSNKHSTAIQPKMPQAQSNVSLIHNQLVKLDKQFQESITKFTTTFSVFHPSTPWKAIQHD